MITVSAAPALRRFRTAVLGKVVEQQSRTARPFSDRTEKMAGQRSAFVASHNSPMRMAWTHKRNEDGKRCWALMSIYSIYFSVSQLLRQ
jgi:hypothetical protein